ncbi:MAG: hypothetical protein HUU50_01135 [Candidatus Brocadiae bacterium]|nr:hypothetical protein [Candidatus Brocadiia bacterium]
MDKKYYTKLIHQGNYAAEIELELTESETGWAPYLSLEDAQKLDEIREALKKGNINKARQLARVFKLVPVESYV